MTDPIRIYTVHDNSRWQLLPDCAPSGRLWFEMGSGHKITVTTNKGPIRVSKGMRTDFLSLPWPFKYLSLTAYPAYRTGAAVHDQMYVTGKHSRQDADHVMLGIWKREREASNILAHLMYFWVRMAGWYNWRQRRKQDHND